MWLWNNVMQPAWEGIKSVIGVAWNLIKGYFDLWSAAFHKVGDAAMWLWNNAIVPAWEGIKSAVSAGWEFIKGIFETMKGGFQGVADFIKGVWNGIGGAISGALDGAINALKGPLHTIGRVLASMPQSVFGVDIPGAEAAKSFGEKLQALRTGGKVRGPGGEDNTLAWLTAGEGVIKKSAMGNGGAEIMEALNAGWVPSAEFLHSMLTGYKRGGMVSLPTTSALDENNLQYNSVLVGRTVAKMFPEIEEIGGYRPSDPYPWHPSGRALDIMIPGGDTQGGRNPDGKKLGDEIHAFLQANADVLGIENMLWQTMTGGNHYNHIDVQTKDSGGAADSDEIYKLSESELEMPSDRSLGGGGGGGGGGGSTKGTPKQIQNAKDRIEDIENRLEVDELALEELEK